MDRNELEKRARAAHDEAYRLKRAAPRITLLNVTLRHYDSDGMAAIERARKFAEDREPAAVGARKSD